MTEARFFSDQSFEKGEPAFLSEEEVRHLQVLRFKRGDRVELINGRSQLAVGQITCLSLKEKKAEVLLENVFNAPLSFRKCTLAQGLPKLKNLDWIIEKGVELGATDFWLFPGERSEKKEINSHQLMRLKHIIISALKQSGRLDMPGLHVKPPLISWKESLQGKAFFGDIREEAPFFSCPKGKEEVTLFVGPEKGFSSEEVKILSSFALGVRLKPYVLRVETAALCFLSLCPSL